MVELRGGLVVDPRPRGAAVEGDVGAAVVAVDHALRVLRVDPHDVRVAVRDAHHVNVLPPSTDLHTCRFITYTVFSSIGSAVTAE